MLIDPSVSSTASSTSPKLLIPCSRMAISRSSSERPCLRTCPVISLPCATNTVGCPSNKRLTIGLRSRASATVRFTRSRTAAATSPPSSEASGPTIAFCTAFAMSKMRTMSKMVIWPSSRLPVRRKPTNTVRYTTSVRIMICQSGVPSLNISTLPSNSAELLPVADAIDGPAAGADPDHALPHGRGRLDATRQLNAPDLAWLDCRARDVEVVQDARAVPHQQLVVDGDRVDDAPVVRRSSEEPAVRKEAPHPDGPHHRVGGVVRVELHQAPDGAIGRRRTRAVEVLLDVASHDEVAL